MIFSLIKYTAIILLVFLQSCGPKRSVSESSAPQPDWVKSRPITPGYYTGIGWAQKTQNVNQYQQTAKQNALADLAGEISVTISSNSVLHAFESNLGFREDFSSTIHTQSREELEGFEIADTWEDQDNYWIYYSLSAARHREIKEKRKNDAVSLSLGLFKNALEEREKGDMRRSLIHLINSMEAINNYFNDPLTVEFRGRSIQLGNEIFNELSSTLSEIIITPQQPQINIKRGQKISADLLKFRVSNNSGKPVSGFPLLAVFSERPIRNNRVSTDRHGYGRFGIDGVRSSETFETLRVSVDIESVLAETKANPATRRLIRRFSLPGETVRINVLKPVIALNAKEKNLGREITGGNLGNSFRRNAVEAGYIVNSDPEEADFIVIIKANTINAGEKGTYRNVILTGTILVKDSDGNMIYHRELEKFRGSHFDLERAGEDAYQQAAGRMESSFFREIDEAIGKES